MSSADDFGSGNLVDAAGKPGRRNQRQRQDHETGEPDPPAIAFIEDLPERRRQQGAKRSGARNHAQHRATHAGGHRARGDRHRDRSGRAGQRHADQHAAADHDREKAVRARHQRKARDVKHRADHHDGAKTVAHGQRTGERLQKSPGEILDGNREREVGNGDADVVRQRLHEDAERLPQAHAQASASATRRSGWEAWDAGVAAGALFLFSLSTANRKPRPAIDACFGYTDLCN